MKKKRDNNKYILRWKHGSKRLKSHICIQRSTLKSAAMNDIKLGVCVTY